MREETDVWFKGKLARILTLYKHVPLTIKLCYAKSYKDLTAGDFNHTNIGAIMCCSGREIWKERLSIEQTKAIIKNFRSSARKNGFRHMGTLSGI
jgi:hypothetical protein